MSLTAIDVHQIQNLYADYNHAIDFGDAAGFAACFAPDGSLDAGFGDPTEGTSALEEFAAATHAMLPGARHVVTNLTFNGDAAAATGRCYLQLWNTSGGSSETSLVISGRYQDTLVKAGDGWRFAHRAMTADA